MLVEAEGSLENLRALERKESEMLEVQKWYGRDGVRNSCVGGRTAQMGRT